VHVISSFRSLGFIYNTSKTNIRRSLHYQDQSHYAPGSAGTRETDYYPFFLEIMPYSSAFALDMWATGLLHLRVLSASSYSLRPLIAPFRWQRRIRWPWDLITLPSRNARVTSFPIEIPIEIVKMQLLLQIRPRKPSMTVPSKFDLNDVIKCTN